MRALKIGFGTVFLVLSLFYLVIVIAMASDAKEDAVYDAKYYLEYEYQDCEKVNGEVVLAGEPVTVFEGYELYRFSFKVRNLSCIESTMHPGTPLEWNMDSYSSAICVDAPFYRDSSALFCDAGMPVLPGKSETDLEIYVQVEKGTRSVEVSYCPNWDEDEVEIEIPLV